MGIVDFTYKTVTQLEAFVTLYVLLNGKSFQSSIHLVHSNTDNIVNDIALHGVIAIDSDRCDIQCQNNCFKRFTCWLNQQFLTMISGGVLLLAPPTYHIQWMHALDGYVFILPDSAGFSQICGGSGSIYWRKRTDITTYPVVIMPCTHCLKYLQLCC